MTELSKRERLEKAVADTKAAFDVAAYAASDAVWGTADVWDDACDAEDAAYAALVKAKRELNEYLKEQDDDKQRS